MPVVNGRRFHYREWHSDLGKLLDQGVTVREAAMGLGKSERACLRAMAKSAKTARPIGRSVRARSQE